MAEEIKPRTADYEAFLKSLKDRGIYTNFRKIIASEHRHPELAESSIDELMTWVADQVREFVK